VDLLAGRSGLWWQRHSRVGDCNGNTVPVTDARVVFLSTKANLAPFVVVRNAVGAGLWTTSGRSRGDRSSSTAGASCRVWTHGGRCLVGQGTLPVDRGAFDEQVA
jgi:hypothetical protein